MKTETFKATKNPWAVTWDFRRSKTTDHVTVRLFKTGSTSPLQTIADTSVEGYGAKTLTETGEFYLDITGAGDWTIQALDGEPDTRQ